jgi:deferrochelatase/peroxidase EfeB
MGFNESLAGNDRFSMPETQADLFVWAGACDGIRDALTRYATPLTGAYYFCPSLNSLQAFAPQPDRD